MWLELLIRPEVHTRTFALERQEDWWRHHPWVHTKSPILGGDVSALADPHLDELACQLSVANAPLMGKR
ncbi:MAG: hypothetical protein ACRD0K_04515 [Egibacteraceae bacterium]